jgi:hypothetical protein
MSWAVDSWVGQGYQHGRWYEYQHLTMRELQALAGPSIDGFRSFAAVRNPYARLLSDYSWRQWIGRDHPGAPVLVFDSLSALIEAIPEDVDTAWDRHIAAADQARANFLIHVRPQHHYIRDQHGESSVDEILSFERLDSDFGRLLEAYAITNHSVVRPPEKNYLAHYDRQMLDTVNRIYARDFALGPYEMI